MSIIKRGASKNWYIQFQLNSQTYIKSSKTTDKRVAEMMEANWRKQLIQQQVIGTRERVLLADILDRFVTSKRELATYSNLRSYKMQVLGYFRSVRYLDDLTSSDLERFKHDWLARGYSQQTVKHLVGLIRGTIKFARRMGYQIPEVEYPRLTISKGRLRYLSFNEERQLLQAIDPLREVKGLAPYAERTELLKREMHDLHDFIVLLLDTGARYNEIATLEWQKVDLTLRTIALWRSKVKNESILYMTDRVHGILSRRMREKESRFVFQNRDGKARGYVASTIRKAFARAGIAGCSAHTLRHTHATRLIQNGLNLYEVKEILGHADIKTTMRYAHIEQSTVSAKAMVVINQLNKANQ
jgi:integrase